jgi:hypothetical protein
MTPALRTLAFGELEPRGVWGAAWIPNSDGAAMAALGVGQASALLADVRVPGAEDGMEWQLDSAATTLVIAPAGDAVAAQASEDGIEGWDQLCRVSGRFERDGAEEMVDCLGLRTWWSGSLDVERYESIRAVSVWFEPDEGLTVTAFRPRKAKAHDRDVLAAALIAPDVSAPVEDPRLSTTYERDGWPARAGLELWLAGDEPERQYPRRASGEATGARAESVTGGHEVRAVPFRWHSRGRDGAGVYLLARHR